MEKDLRKILTPDEFNMALVAAAQAGGKRGLVDELAAAIHTLEPTLEGTKITPKPMGDRERYEYLVSKGLDLEWVVPPETETDITPSVSEEETKIYTPRQDFLMVAVEAQENLEVLLDVVNNLKGEERAQLLNYLAGNGDWSDMRDHLRKIADVTPKEALENYTHLVEYNTLRPGGTNPFRPIGVKPNYEHPRYIGPHVDTMA